MDVTKEIEQRAQQAAQAGADHCALCSISRVTSTLASVYGNNILLSICHMLAKYLNFSSVKYLEDKIRYSFGHK